MRTKLAVWSAMVLAGLALAGCDKGNERQLQGWVEAELVFISSDEQGRVENLKVREGDQVKQGDLLFSVDDDLQKADLVVKKTAVVNAQQNFDRAKELLKTAAGTQKTYDDAEAALRDEAPQDRGRGERLPPTRGRTLEALEHHIDPRGIGAQPCVMQQR